MNETYLNSVETNFEGSECTKCQYYRSFWSFYFVYSLIKRCRAACVRDSVRTPAPCNLVLPTFLRESLLHGCLA